MRQTYPYKPLAWGGPLPLSLESKILLAVKCAPFSEGSRPQCRLGSSGGRGGAGRQCGRPSVLTQSLNFYLCGMGLVIASQWLSREMSQSLWRTQHRGWKHTGSVNILLLLFMMGTTCAELASVYQAGPV